MILISAKRVDQRELQKKWFLQKRKATQFFSSQKRFNDIAKTFWA